MKRTTGPNRLRWAIIICSSLLFSPANAWKIDVHAWIATQVLEDAKDGTIVIELGEGTQKNSVRINIPRKYAVAIRQSPEMFVLGSLGPDAFPDVVAGQTVIHPSVAGGWGTSEWLQHLMDSPGLSNDELAFVLGYLTHAASDTFAHTFVNRYAGDVFDLSDHPTAAVRHIKIESFVSNYLPPITHPRTGKLSDAADLLRINGRVEFPENMVKERLLLNASAADQYSKGGGVHLSAAYQLHQSLDELLAEDGLLRDLEKTAIDLAAELYLGIPIDDEITGALVDLHTKMNEKLNEGAAELKQLALDLNEGISELEGLNTDFAEQRFLDAANLADDGIDLAAKILTLNNNLDDAVKELDKVKNTYDEIKDKVCDSVAKYTGFCIVWKEVTKKVETEAWKLAKQSVTDIQNTINRTRDDLKTVSQDARVVIRDTFDVVRQAHEIHKLARDAIIKFTADTISGDQFREHFERWRDGIPVALVEFTRANATAIVNSIDPNKPSVTEPLATWLVCYGPVFLSVPHGPLEDACKIYEEIGNLQDELDELESSVADLAGLGEILKLKKKIEGEIQKIKAKIFNIAITEGLREFDKHARTPTLPLYKALTEEMTESDLNAEFSIDSSGQGLPLIPDVGARVKIEMAIQEGSFDATEFNAVYNSVALSKLALLDSAGLRRLAAFGEIENSIYGPRLYGDGSVEGENVLFGFLRSIDGNHQWQELAPPHPRTGGFDNADFDQRYTYPNTFGFGYRDSGCERVKGMRLWVDRNARENLFKQIFRGPVIAGVDSPQSLGDGFARTLHSTYPELFGDDLEWGRDAITLKEQSVALRLLGEGKPNGRVLISTRDHQLGELEYDENGKLNASLSISSKALPGYVHFKETGGRNAITFGFPLGCSISNEVVESGARAEVVVEQGDTLWHITKRITGDGNKYPELVAANSEVIADPNLIFPGQTFMTPWHLPVSINGM